EYHGLGGGRKAALHVWRSHEHGWVEAPQRLGLLRELSRDTHAEVGRQLAMLAQDTPIVMDDLALVEMPCWHRGRILLAGDAAHSLSLISGQGAGMALAGAYVLAQELGRLPLEQALA
ncbi:FAD-dependent monooxygenase, partial [Klebsiella pneumoniae]|uniref:FAD-dependent monooxygenase n=1 Tax=Klebsiella pneumoniae TaxID=573 RepID=UPI0015FB818E